MNETNPNLGPGVTNLLTSLHIPLDKVGRADDSASGETQCAKSKTPTGFREETVKPKSFALHCIILTIGTLVILSPMLAYAVSMVAMMGTNFKLIDFGSSIVETVDKTADFDETTTNDEPIIEETTDESVSDYNSGDMYEQMYDETLCNRQLTEDDLYGWSSSDLRILRNMIYAKHGYIFKKDDMREHFSQYSWYEPFYDDVSDMLSSVEKYNVAFIKNHE